MEGTREINLCSVKCECYSSVWVGFLFGLGFFWEVEDKYCESDLSTLMQGMCGMVQVLLGSLVRYLFYVSKTTYLLALGSC